MYETPRFAIATHGATNMPSALPTKDYDGGERRGRGGCGGGGEKLTAAAAGGNCAVGAFCYALRRIRGGFCRFDTSIRFRTSRRFCPFWDASILGI